MEITCCVRYLRLGLFNKSACDLALGRGKSWTTSSKSFCRIPGHWALPCEFARNSDTHDSIHLYTYQTWSNHLKFDDFSNNPFVSPATFTIFTSAANGYSTRLTETAPCSSGSGVPRRSQRFSRAQRSRASSRLALPERRALRWSRWETHGKPNQHVFQPTIYQQMSVVMMLLCVVFHVFSTKLSVFGFYCQTPTLGDDKK